jgi:hypothetical protein
LFALRAHGQFAKNGRTGGQVSKDPYEGNYHSLDGAGGVHTGRGSRKRVGRVAGDPDSLEGPIPGIPGEDYPIYATVLDTGFSCEGQVNNWSTNIISIYIVQG